MVGGREGEEEGIGEERGRDGRRRKKEEGEREVLKGEGKGWRKRRGREDRRRERGEREVRQGEDRGEGRERRERDGEGGSSWV